MTSLQSLCRVLRSKNSGPFELTLDILLPDRESYERVLASGLITRENIASLYHISPQDIVTLARMDQAYGIKITLLRQVSSGTVGDRDVYGAQQIAPLMNLMIP